jgi:hypothetical protein
MTENKPEFDLRLETSLLSRYWIYTPLLICILIMLPRLISPHFGLMDDGRALTIAQGIVHGKWDLSWDVIAGRARPVYWTAFAFWYLLAGDHPFWYFLGNLIVFSATTYLLIWLVRTLGGSRHQAWFTGLVFTLSTSIIEDVYTLSKAENFQVLLMLGSIGLVVQAARSAKGTRVWLLLASASFLLLVASFTKESTLLLLPIAIVWWVVARLVRLKHIQSGPFVEKVSRWIIFCSLVSGILFYLGRTILLSSSKILGVGQSSDFFFDRSNILNSLVRWGGWILRDYFWLLPMTLIVLVWCLIKRRWPRSGLWWLAGVWMAFWLGMYIPWHFAVEYYLLPFAAGTAVLAGGLLIEMIDMIKLPGALWKWVGALSLSLTAILLLVTQANSFTDGSIQLAQDAANTHVLEYIAQNAPERSRVIVNIQLANEYIEQMQLILANFYHRSDLQLVIYQGEDLSHQIVQAQKTYFLLADLANQPKMTVRMGLDEPSLQVWNASVMPITSTWNMVYQVSESPRILTVDFPRLLCSVIKRASYCSAVGGLVNYKQLHYQWSVYTP